MAFKKFFIGSEGPYYYDDADNVEDPDSDITSTKQSALTTEGKMKAKEPPSDSDDVARKSEVDGKSVSYTKETTTVVTSVDFTNETVTTKDITYVTDITQ